MHAGKAWLAAAQPAVVRSTTVNGGAATTSVTFSVIPEGSCPSQPALMHSAEPLAFPASGLVLPIGNPGRDIETPPPPPLPDDCDDGGPVPTIGVVAVNPILVGLDFTPVTAACPPQLASSRTNRPASELKRRVRGRLKVTPTGTRSKIVRHIKPLVSLAPPRTRLRNEASTHTAKPGSRAVVTYPL
jgi:hypothetical protein